MTSAEHGDVQVLAREMANAYRDLVSMYREQLKLSPDEAHARAVDRPHPNRLAQIAADPEQAQWWDLSALAEQDDMAARSLWRHIMDSAERELATGHHAAKALSFDTRPMDRARFLAVRAALSDEHTPASGIERLLIDTAAQAFTLYSEWIDMFHQRTHVEMVRERSDVKRQSKWDASMHYSAAIEQAADMAEHWHRVFLRTIRQLQDIRRAGATVVLQNHGQVNIGQEQTNIATRERPPSRRPRHARKARH
jgi:hypothetical protein